MKTWKKLLLSSPVLAPIVLAPIAVAVSCDNSKKVSDLEKQLQEAREKLKKAEVDAERYKKVGTAYTNAWNTFSIDKDAMTSGQYKHAKLLFQKMIQQANIDAGKVNKDTGVVSNPDSGKRIPVVFMDIDDTILNNFAYQNWLLVEGKSYNAESWDQFVQSKTGKAIKGAIEFIKWVWENGGIVMFNSNRKQGTQLQATRENLKALGLDEKYLKDWVWWMSGTNTKDAKPWTKSDGKDSKEERMHTVDTKSFDLSAYGSGNNVSLVTVMKIGDDLNDFHDNATKRQGQETVNKAFKEYEHLFGNDDTTKKGKYYDPKTKAWTETNFATSYIHIGGNASYGGWLYSLFKSHNSDIDILLKKLSESAWKPTV